jgi:glycosyltransferase involved in cell wall biosynthesis
MIPKITTIIPTYNSEKTIERALDSVILQEGNNELFTLEILVCDDKSNDNTWIICRDYPCRFIVNDRHTGGPNEGRNNGIRNATGDVICFLDHDDEWLPWKLKEQLKQIKKGYEFVYSPCIKEMESGS